MLPIPVLLLACVLASLVACSGDGGDDGADTMAETGSGSESGETGGDGETGTGDGSEGETADEGVTVASNGCYPDCPGCEAQDAEAPGCGVNPSEGAWKWDGSDCVWVDPACGCTGIDCENLYPSEQMCDAAHAACG